MSGSFDLTDRVAIVTGANAGIGRAIAVALAGAGADVVGVGRRPAEQTASEIMAIGRRSLLIHADLSTIEPVDPIVSETLQHFARLDILVNNAGVIRRADAVDFSEADWDAATDVNLKSVFFLSQVVGRHMMSTGRGRIINIASMLTFQGGVRVASYTAAKAGVGGITKLLANEWAGRGINVNAIAPGYIATDNTTALREDPNRNRAIVERIPAGRLGAAFRPRRSSGLLCIRGRRLRPRSRSRSRWRLASTLTEMDASFDGISHYIEQRMQSSSGQSNRPENRRVARSDHTDPKNK